MKIKVFIFFLFFLVAIASVHADLEVGYYNKKNCSQAENVVGGVVIKYLLLYPLINDGVAPGLVRMLFHDCFVGGCDGSVLLDSGPNNFQSEKNASRNLGLRGFEIIDEAKELLEKECPGIVSCADILVFAARDASEYLNGVKFDVSSGRLDSKVSYYNEVETNLPPPEFNLTQLKDLYVSKKGLTVKDLVVLSGAHTFGRSHCSSIKSHLDSNDGTLDPNYAEYLRERCTSEYPYNYYKDDDVVNLDIQTPYKLDSKYYQNVKSLTALFFSDWSLLTGNDTLPFVNEYAAPNNDWDKDFAVSMEKLSRVNYITDPEQGEIRESCRAVNPSYN